MTSAGHFLLACADDRSTAARAEATLRAARAEAMPQPVRTMRATMLPVSKGDSGARATANSVRSTAGALDIIVEVVPPDDRDVERAVLDVLRVQLRGADPREVAGLVRGHVTYRSPGGPAAWIRCLTELRRELPQHTEGLEQLAVHAMSCR